MPRLFTGLEIPAEIGQTLSNMRGGLPGARWIDPENYHVTLRFIGDIDGVAANEIASMLFRVNRKPFDVTLQGLSSFGGRKPRAVVASVVPSRPLIELQAELERLMQRIGLDPEGRKFTPHVTLLYDNSSVAAQNIATIKWSFRNSSPRQRASPFCEGYVASGRCSSVAARSPPRIDARVFVCVSRLRCRDRHRGEVRILDPQSVARGRCGGHVAVHGRDKYLTLLACAVCRLVRNSWPMLHRTPSRWR